MEIMKTLNRRHLLQTLVMASGSYALGAMAAGKNPPEKGNTQNPSQPWRYVTLDAEQTSELSYQLHTAATGCMYGVFTSIVTQLAAKVGEPYKSFPCEMMYYGKGGVAEWGTLCGTLNGGAAAISLLVRNGTERNALIDALFSYYQDTKLPQYVPKNPASKMEIPAVKTGSVLCHPSVSAWIKQAKVSAYSDERKERCRRLSADMAHKTVELLNASFAGTAVKPANLGDKTTGCLSCHGKDGALADVSTKSCTGCHFPDVKEHP
jgi:hypothetical protein